MQLFFYLGAVLTTAGCLCMPGAVQAQATPGTYPDHEVKLVVPIQPNGIIDAIAQPAAQGLARVTGRPVVVDYRPGALTRTGSDLVAKAAADGYTLLAQSRQLVNNVFIFRQIPFDTRADLTPVTLVARTGFLLVVNPKLPVRSVEELVALAKARPGFLKYAGSGRASNQQMSVELFKQLSGTDMTLVDYEGGGGAQDAVIKGDADLGIFAQVAVVQMVKDGRMRALATTGARRSTVFPELPTVSESGLPGYEFSSWVGIFAPRGTPPALVDTIYSQLKKTAADAGFDAAMARQGADVVMSSPSEFKEFIDREFSLWGPVIKRAGLSPE